MAPRTAFLVAACGVVAIAGCITVILVSLGAQWRIACEGRSPDGDETAD